MQFTVSEPLVSIVIVNWNYARYVADAIDSVKEQSYRNFECVVVDNGSTDGSADVIAASIDGNPQFKLLQLPANLGHLGAGCWALDHVRGEFVTFLDADDVLFPEYLAEHLLVHLSTIYPTGLTSSNIVDVNTEGAKLDGGHCWMSLAWNSGTPSLRPKERTVCQPALADCDYAVLADATRYVSAGARGWLWCPTSSNMFRRSLLHRVRPKTDSAPIFGGLDSFFLPIVHAITGSNLIDRPLSAYRVHENNNYSSLPHLTGRARTGKPRAEARNVAVLSLLVRSVIEDCESMPFAIGELWDVLDVVASSDQIMRPFEDPEVQAVLSRRFEELVRQFGERRVLSELRRRLGFRDCMRILFAARTGALPLAAIAQAASMEISTRVQRRLKGA